MEEEYGEIKRKFQNINNPDSDPTEFEQTFNISDSPMIKAIVRGEKNDNDRWGVDKYAVDARIDMKVNDVKVWEDEENAIDSFILQMKKILKESIGFSGPIILRANENETERSWARRLINKTDN
jgi:hypothetical protein